MLVIDDEADQASIDVGRNQRSTVNAAILELLGVPKAAYIGYTATPYANLFIDPGGEDLYPRDFIIDLEKPEGYFGPDRIFGQIRGDEDAPDDDGYDIVRIVPDEEATAHRPPRNATDRHEFEPDLTPSLEDALRYFLLATAARRARGFTGHSTMLVHTTTYTDVHQSMRAPIEEEILRIAALLSRQDGPLEEELRDLWRRETGRVPASAVHERETTYEDLEGHLRDVVDEAVVVIDNYRSAERLDYPLDEEAEPLTVIVVGGNTLSRGLTLRGLVVSYFLRTASAYDTLQQMGRWFGYRRGYSDLPRVWMTGELQGYFYDLAVVEEEIRTDIARYEAEHKTPMELVTRVRTHPTLAITSAMKMGAARRCDISFSGSRQQTFLFNHRDVDELSSNWAAGRRLIADSRTAGAQVKEMRPGQWRTSRVPVSLVERFLAEYAFHPMGPFKPEPARRYIRRQNELGELLEWNVVVIGRDDGAHGKVDLDLPEEIGLIVRARLPLQLAHANIKSVMSRIDRIADLDIDRSGLTGAGDDVLKGLRDSHGGAGLICLYPIDSTSAPERTPPPGKLPRVPLDAANNVLGVGIIFPETPHRETTVEYMAVPLPAEGGLEEEEIDPEADDTEPSYDGAGLPEAS